MRTGTERLAGIGDEAVREATGRTWDEWLAYLDAAHAAALDHRGIVAILDERTDLSGWWCQMVAVAYEQARGLRRKHQKPGGWEIGRSKVVAAPVAELWTAWSDEGRRAAWLKDEDLEVRTAHENRSIRFTWADGESVVDVRFSEKGPARTQVAVQHGKLPDADAAERMKAYWGEALGRLAAYLTR